MWLSAIDDTDIWHNRVGSNANLTWIANVKLA